MTRVSTRGQEMLSKETADLANRVRACYQGINDAIDCFNSLFLFIPP